MKFIPTELPGVIIIEPDVHRDTRGFFLETYHEQKYRAGGIREKFVQDNHSKSGKLTLRGLHLQLKKPQGKLVRVLQGEVFDVAVDVRVGSPTFGKWVGAVLSSENFRQIYIPPGFAHGFVVLTMTAETEYKCTALYDKDDELGILWNDPDINIQWPASAPILSEKDKRAARLKDLLPTLSRYPAYRA